MKRSLKLLVLVAASFVGFSPASSFRLPSGAEIARPSKVELVQSARASEDIVGTITSTSPTDKNNSTTSVPFSLKDVSVVFIQCDAVSYFRQGVTATASVAVATGRQIAAAPDGLYLDIRTRGKFIAIVPGAGTANCKVFSVL